MPPVLPSSRRQRIVATFVTTIVVASAVSLLTQRELWPFSPYTMFAALQGPNIDVFQVVGVKTDESEVSMTPSRFTALVSGSRYQAALELLVRNGHQHDTRMFLERAARQYARLRDDAVELKAVRLYRSRWQAAPNQWPPMKLVSRDEIVSVDVNR